MVSTAGVVYVIFAMVLFFFWIYGIASFVHDVRTRYLPRLRAYLGEDEQSRDRVEERLDELYKDPDE